MKHFISALSLTLLFSGTVFANGTSDLILNADGSPFETIEKILLNRNGEEVECGVCCSWTTTGKNCIPTCFIEDGNMIPAAAITSQD